MSTLINNTAKRITPVTDAKRLFVTNDVILDSKVVVKFLTSSHRLNRFHPILSQRLFSTRRMGQYERTHLAKKRVLTV